MTFYSSTKEGLISRRTETIHFEIGSLDLEIPVHTSARRYYQKMRALDSDYKVYHEEIDEWVDVETAIEERIGAADFCRDRIQELQRELERIALNRRLQELGVRSETAKICSACKQYSEASVYPKPVYGSHPLAKDREVLKIRHLCPNCWSLANAGKLSEPLLAQALSDNHNVASGSLPTRKLNKGGDMTTGKVKSKASKAVPVASASPVTNTGVADKRYKYPPGTRPTRARGTTPGQTRQATMTALLSGKEWAFVSEGFDPVGVKSVTGAKLKRYFTLRNKATDEQVVVGRGEMIKYAGVQPPSKRAQKTQNEAQFGQAFGQPQNTDEETSGDLSFLDEPKI